MDIIVVIAFLLIIGALLYERHSLTGQHTKEKDRILDELSRTNKALISKNANDYVMTTGIDKFVPDKTPAKMEPETQPLETASDDEFMAAIRKQNSAEDAPVPDDPNLRQEHEGVSEE